MSIFDLKSKILIDFQIPIDAQRWVLNNRLAIDDSQPLNDYGLKENSSIFLYVIANETNGIGEQKKILNIADPQPSPATTTVKLNNELGAQALPLPYDTDTYGTLKVGWACPLCTLINAPNRPGCVACSENRPVNYSIPIEYKDREHTFELPDELKKFLADDMESEPAAPTRRPQEKSNDLNKISLSRKSTELFNIIVNTSPLPAVAVAVTKESKQEKTANEPKTKSRFQTSIVMTAITASPNITKNKYRGVDNYNPHVIKYGDPILPLSAGAIPKPIRCNGKPFTAEPKPVCDKKVSVELVPPNVEPIKTNSKHYNELLNLDSSDIISNTEPFECPICLTVCERNFGITLRNCLHVFCKECIVNTVKYSEEAEVKCPYIDNDYSCDCILSEREIKALVSKDAYEQHLAVSLRLAENRIENAFHCKTPNCRGWCIYEDNVNLFKCPICHIANCLTCRVMTDFQLYNCWCLIIGYIII